ncbi:Granule-associated protein (plasmid) [Cupriavidus necator H850]|uniref:phasin family protein n=1 Tax=Cupriavidus necator TaxID=106590 RepID=UPI0020BFD1AF|nr:phasin family protein [Cupriavidus necator]KAI3603546.1 Granule-associated protein [Cupriavidus necator H850]
MILTQEQILAVHQSNLESLCSLTSKAIEGYEKLVELNMQVAKAALTENLDGVRRALSAKEPREFLEVHVSLVQPAGEKAMAYARQVYEITLETQKELAKVAKAMLTEGSQKLRESVDNLAKNAPAGTESAVAIVKSAIAAADNAYESVEKAATQAVVIAESNIQAVATVATNAAQQVGVTARAASKKTSASV